MAEEEPRMEKLQRLLEMDIDPWGQRFDDRMLIADIRARADEVCFKSEAVEEPVSLPEVDDENRQAFKDWLEQQGRGEFVGPKVRAAGRIVLQRKKGKLRFVDIRDHTGQIQLFIGRGQVGEDNWAISEQFDLGDIVAVDGQLRRTKMGELTIFAERLHFLTKALEPPPEKYHGLTNLELRQRMRYLDLTYGEGVMDRFIERIKIIDSVRATLKRRRYFEVEGPTLHVTAGGAAARPFGTHHNALDMDLSLRIALELHLKRLLVGGMDRVFELGRVYRNEGISPKHNPEFTMLEAYEAFGNYETMMELTEQLIVDAIEALGKGFQLPWGDQQIDYSPPFERATYNELFERHAGIDPQDDNAIRELAKSIGIEVANRHIDVIKNDVFEEKVEDALIGPIFVIDYPASICPLTKRKRDIPQVAERFELFVDGMEVANAYTELNDPILQEQLFKTQLAGLPEEDSMAKMDHDFIRALRHGMPPAGGLGVGIDRLVMLLTNSSSIRDVVLFPLLRPEALTT